MAKSYTWKPYPATGAPDFEETARDSLDTNKNNCESMDEELTGSRDTYQTLAARLAAIVASIADASGIQAGAITESLLDCLNSPAAGKVLSCNVAAGKKFEWISQGSATDTMEVRMDAADPPGFLEEKCDGKTIIVNAGKKYEVVFENNIIAWF